MTKPMLSLWLIVKHSVFQSDWLEESLCPGLIKNWELVPLMHSEVLSAVSRDLFTHMPEADLYSAEYLRETLCRSLEFSLYAALCLLVLLSYEEFQPPSSVWTLSSVSSTQGDLWFLLPNWGYGRAYLLCFPSLRDHYPYLLMF